MNAHCPSLLGYFYCFSWHEKSHRMMMGRTSLCIYSFAFHSHPPTHPPTHPPRSAFAAAPFPSSRRGGRWRRSKRPRRQGAARGEFVAAEQLLRGAELWELYGRAGEAAAAAGGRRGRRRQAVIYLAKALAGDATAESQAEADIGPVLRRSWRAMRFVKGPLQEDEDEEDEDEDEEEDEEGDGDGESGIVAVRPEPMRTTRPGRPSSSPKRRRRPSSRSRKAQRHHRSDRRGGRGHSGGVRGKASPMTNECSCPLALFTCACVLYMWDVGVKAPQGGGG